MLERLDESLAEDLLSDAYTAAEIIEQIRTLGGDPGALGARGKALGVDVVRRAASLLPAMQVSEDASGQHLQASPFAGISISRRDQNLLEDVMNKDFEFKQLLRAYRSGIISEHTFETEMMGLEKGGSNGGSAGGFKAFGRSYASEREAVIKFLEVVAPAEAAGGDAVRA